MDSFFPSGGKALLLGCQLGFLAGKPFISDGDFRIVFSILLYCINLAALGICDIGVSSLFQLTRMYHTYPHKLGNIIQVRRDIVVRLCGSGF